MACRLEVARQNCRKVRRKKKRRKKERWGLNGARKLRSLLLCRSNLSRQKVRAIQVKHMNRSGKKAGEERVPVEGFQERCCLQSLLICDRRWVMRVSSRKRPCVEGCIKRKDGKVSAKE